MELVTVYTIYLPDFALIIQLIGLVVLYLLIRTAIKLTPFIG